MRMRKEASLATLHRHRHLKNPATIAITSSGGSFEGQRQVLVWHPFHTLAIDKTVRMYPHDELLLCICRDRRNSEHYDFLHQAGTMQALRRMLRSSYTGLVSFEHPTSAVA